MCGDDSADRLSRRQRGFAVPTVMFMLLAAFSVHAIAGLAPSQLVGAGREPPQQQLQP